MVLVLVVGAETHNKNNTIRSRLGSMCMRSPASKKPLRSQKSQRRPATAFLRRSQQEEIAPRRGPPKEDHDGRDGEHFWRRLALRALLALSAARLQVILYEVVEIEPAYSFYHESPRARRTDGLPSTVSRAAISMRPQLTDSKSSR